MPSQRHLLGLVIALAAVGSAEAQSGGSLRWRGGTGLGLQVGQPEVRVPCGGFALSCDGAILPLYASAKAPRTLSMQVERGDPLSPFGAGLAPTVSVSLVGKAGLPWDLGVYGRVGTTFNRAALAPNGAGEGGLTYGIGLSWDFSRRGSAALGLDRYDMRSGVGEARDVRTSLGLRWRY